MFIVILIIAGILYFMLGFGYSERKTGLNYKLLLAAIICSSLTLVTAGKREEMTAMFVIVSIGLWIAFEYDKYLKKNLTHGSQYIENVSDGRISTTPHPYRTDKIFRDAQKAYGEVDITNRGIKEESKLPSSIVSSTKVQIVNKKYYIFGKNIYISDNGVEKGSD